MNYQNVSIAICFYLFSVPIFHCNQNILQLFFFLKSVVGNSNATIGINKWTKTEDSLSWNWRSTIMPWSDWFRKTTVFGKFLPATSQASYPRLLACDSFSSPHKIFFFRISRVIFFIVDYFWQYYSKFLQVCKQIFGSLFASIWSSIQIKIWQCVGKRRNFCR